MIKTYYNIIKKAQFLMEQDLVENSFPKVMKDLENGFTLTIGEDIQNDNQVFFILAENGHEEFYEFQEKFPTYEDAQKALNRIPINIDIKNHPAWLDVDIFPKLK